MDHSISADAPPLLLRREGAVLVLSNHNPAARNALSPAFYTALTEALQAAQADSGVGAIVLTGEGGHFCSGGDLRQLAKRRDLPEADRRARLDDLNAVIRAVRACGKPIVAAVEGAAAGAGFSLALACDLLVAARDASFSLAYVKVGLTPDAGATAFLAGFVSRQLLAELCLTGDRISGERLHALGAVNRLVEPGQALGEATALAARIADGPQQAMARIKALCGSAHAASLDEQLEREARAMVASQATEESREGIAAFLEKRPADFSALRGGGDGGASG